jgi:hypothetical protein
MTYAITWAEWEGHADASIRPHAAAEWELGTFATDKYRSSSRARVETVQERPEWSIASSASSWMVFSVIFHTSSMQLAPCELYPSGAGAGAPMSPLSRRGPIAAKQESKCVGTRNSRAIDSIAGAPGSTAATPSGLMLKAKNVNGSLPGLPVGALGQTVHRSRRSAPLPLITRVRLTS